MPEDGTEWTDVDGPERWKPNRELINEITDLVGYERDHDDEQIRKDTLQAVARHVATQQAKLRERDE